MKTSSQLSIILVILGAVAWYWTSGPSHTSVGQQDSQVWAGSSNRPGSTADSSPKSRRVALRPPAGGENPLASHEAWKVVLAGIIDQAILAASQGVPPDWSGVGTLELKINADPRLLDQIIDHTRREQRPEALDVLRMVLAGKPEAEDLAMSLVIKGSAAQRKFAFDLLQDYPASAEINRLALQAISTEQDPAALASALAALRPIHARDANAFAAAKSQATTSDLEKQAMANTLQSLMQHDSPAVRSQSLSALAEWNVDQGVMFASVSVALSDEAPEVRQAALATLINQVDRQAFTAPLIEFLARDDEAIEVQAMAWQLLQGMPMTSAERALHDEMYVLLAASFQSKKAASTE
jgi:hypothetical protein